MSTDNVKNHLFSQYGTEQKNWKRISKQTLENGDEVRVFQDKTNGLTFKTIESKDGIISSEPYTLTQSPTPQQFKFCFLEDSNPDHFEALEEAAASNNSQTPVTGFNLFFFSKATKNKCIHLEELLKPFLPEFLGEVEESTFCVHPEYLHVYDSERDEGIADGSIPIVTYESLISTLENTGFIYDKKNCMLSSLYVKPKK